MKNLFSVFYFVCGYFLYDNLNYVASSVGARHEMHEDLFKVRDGASPHGKINQNTLWKNTLLKSTSVLYRQFSRFWGNLLARVFGACRVLNIGVHSNSKIFYFLVVEQGRGYILANQFVACHQSALVTALHSVVFILLILVRIKKDINDNGDR